MIDRVGLLAEWARAVASTEGQLSLPMRLCRACAEILDTDGGAITLAYTRPARVTLCATDSNAARLEDLQDVLGQGPGPEAYNSGETVIVTLDVDSPSNPWLMLSDAAGASLGFSATVYALPIRPETAVLGVLTLYQQRVRPLARDVSAAQFLADALGAALLRDPDSRTELARGPWASRALVHQATGMVIAQLRVGPEDALALLRAHAFADDSPLEQIALDVTEGRLDFSAINGFGNESS
jgi:hypothetical protein